VRQNSFLTAFSAAALAFGVAVPAASAADFAGKTVTVIVPSGSGGTFHIYGQIFARHIGKHLPGNPTVVVQNRPGAGGVKAANYAANAAPADGTVMSEINPGSVVVPLLRKVKYDARKFKWLGTLATRTYTLGVWHNVDADTLEKHKSAEVVMGSSGVGSINYQIPYFLNAVMGTKYKIIKGYKGGGAINLAMERGEVQGRGNFYSGYTGAKPHWIRDKKVKFFATLGPSRPEVAGVPKLSDFITGTENKKMYSLLEVGFHVGQSFFLPPGAPKDVVDTSRKAFDAMMKDPEMLADAKKRRVPVRYASAAEVSRIVDEAYKVESHVADKLGKILGYKK
jgi:tripartite-type tricarboxylate transporter receptor subunit TctC